MIEQIKASIIAHSVSENTGKEIITFELEYPRFIHSEFMTHRLFSRNAASSRAIPVTKMLTQVWNNPAMPVYWGKNQAGMQSDTSLIGWHLTIANTLWKFSAKVAASLSWLFMKLGVHKQLANRITEPFQMMKVVMTTTELEQFFHLRDDKDAQPEIKILAIRMREAITQSVPRVLKKGDWHLPYVNMVDIGGHWQYVDETGHAISIHDAKVLSASCCAQVSYRMLNHSMERAEMIYAKLNLDSDTNRPAHASPVEHQATPIYSAADHGISVWTKFGIREKNLDQLWSGNFRGWVQFRKTLKNEAKF